MRSRAQWFASAGAALMVVSAVLRPFSRGGGTETVAWIIGTIGLGLLIWGIANGRRE